MFSMVFYLALLNFHNKNRLRLFYLENILEEQHKEITVQSATVN